MGKVYDEIDGRLREFILAQPMFFVATAPSGPDGHVNVSPKGMAGTFAVLGPHGGWPTSTTPAAASRRSRTCATTAAITLMFCAFAGPPNIVRLHGRGEAVLPGDARFPELRAAFAASRGPRRAQRDRGRRASGSATRAASPCRTWTTSGERPLLEQWAANRSEADLVAYRAGRNAAHHRRSARAGLTGTRCTLGSSHGHPRTAAARGALAVAGGAGLDPASGVRRQEGAAPLATGPCRRPR